MNEDHIKEIEQLEKVCRDYENQIKKLEDENRNLKNTINKYDELFFAIKSILKITEYM